MRTPTSRRQFLGQFAALSGMAMLPAAQSFAAAKTTAASAVDLRATSFEKALFAEGAATRFWGFDDQLPGPQLRFKKGERVRIAVKNALPVDTAVHWHGLRVPNAMDGVPFVTQHPIKPGEEYIYEFDLPDSGSYWYHPHQNSFEQVSRGMYGAFIVEERRPIAVDQELVWVLSDVKLDASQQPVEDFGRITDLANEGRLGTHVLLNGALAGMHRAFPVRPGERVRFRLINASSARVFHLALPGHTVQVVAWDGQGVTPYPVDELVLGPGMRADVVVDFLQKNGASAAWEDRHRRSLGPIAAMAYEGKPQRSRALKSSIIIERNRLPEPDVSKATDHYIVFQGGMRGAPVIGTIDGKPSKILELMEKSGLAWTMNFTAQHEHALMHEPLLYLKKGEHVVLRMINETDYAHPMHLHGHFFKVLAANGRRLANPEWRDTVLMGPRESLDVAFVADNLGEWMFHCHILDHAAGGMMGTIAVE